MIALHSCSSIARCGQVEGNQRSQAGTQTAGDLIVFSLAPPVKLAAVETQAFRNANHR